MTELPERESFFQEVLKLEDETPHPWECACADCLAWLACEGSKPIQLTPLWAIAPDRRAAVREFRRGLGLL